MYRCSHYETWLAMALRVGWKGYFFDACFTHGLSGRKTAPWCRELVSMAVLMKRAAPGVCVGVAILVHRAVATDPRASCLSYEPTLVTLRGTLVRKTFAGPPNHDSMRKGDRAETYSFVHLPTSVCVDEDKQNPDLNPVRNGAREVKLVDSPKTIWRTSS